MVRAPQPPHHSKTTGRVEKPPPSPGWPQAMPYNSVNGQPRVWRSCQRSATRRVGKALSAWPGQKKMKLHTLLAGAMVEECE